MATRILAGLAFLFLVPCGADEDLSLPPEPLGQFRLGHNIAIADEVVRGPFSRQLDESKLEASVQNAVAKRLRRYDGNGLYHLGIVVGGVVLAQPGIPVVYAPRSVMIVDVTVFDNSENQLNQDRAVAEREGLEIRTVQGDMKDLHPFDDQSFDLIFHPCSNTFVSDVRPVARNTD